MDNNMEVVMFKRMIAILLIASSLVVALGGAAAAQAPVVDLPPSIAAQAEPLVLRMIGRMEGMGMGSDHVLGHMRVLSEALPPGIFLQFLELALQLDMPAMVTLHKAVFQEGLLQQPPGEVLLFVRGLAG